VEGPKAEEAEQEAENHKHCDRNDSRWIDPCDQENDKRKDDSTSPVDSEPYEKSHAVALSPVRCPSASDPGSLIDLEEDQAARAVVVGLLAEMERK